MLAQTWNKAIFSFLGFTLLSGLLSCDQENLNCNELELFLISYSKHSSWTDYSYNATIDRNGYVQIIENSRINNQNRESKYHLSNNDLFLIKEKLTDLVEIDILDEYGFDNENSPTDLPTQTFKYNTNIKSDSTSIYFPTENELPIEFDSFMKTLEQVLLEYDTLLND